MVIYVFTLPHSRIHLNVWFKISLTMMCPTHQGDIFAHPNSLPPQIHNFGLAYQGKDIVFRFIIIE